MQKYFTALLAYLLPTKSVASISKFLVKAITDLEQVEAEQTAAGVGIERQIAELQQRAADAAKEAADAAAVKANISKLLMK